MDGSSYSSVMAIFDQLWRIVLLAVIILGLLLGFLFAARFVLPASRNSVVTQEDLDMKATVDDLVTAFRNHDKRLLWLEIAAGSNNIQALQAEVVDLRERVASLEGLKKQALEKEFDPDARAFQHQLRPAWRK